MTILQPPIPGVPEDAPTPAAYLSAGDAIETLITRWALTASLTEGHLLAASMHLDEEGPFMGVKFVVTQEREWPRTFKYGWPNLIATPTPVMVSRQYPGAFYLDYEGVVPQQVVDWVCLEAYRMVTSSSFSDTIVQESVTGASVRYASPKDGFSPPELERIQAGLLAPFQVRQGHTSPFMNYSSL